MTDLSRELRRRLADDFDVSTPAIAERHQSTDGTEKFLLTLHDGRQIESVFIPDTPAMTFCISTQVGCAMKCGFCTHGKMGLLRNLTAGESPGKCVFWRASLVSSTSDSTSSSWVWANRFTTTTRR